MDFSRPFGGAKHLDMSLPPLIGTHRYLQKDHVIYIYIPSIP